MGENTAIQEDVENKIITSLTIELNDLRKDFTQKVNQIRERYFTDSSALIVLQGVEGMDVSFCYDIDKLFSIQEIKANLSTN